MSIALLNPVSSAERNTPDSNIGIQNWQKIISNKVLPLECIEIDETDFNGRITLKIIEKTTVFNIQTTPHAVNYTADFISQPSNKYYKLNLQIKGTAAVEQDGRRTVLSPGDLVIYDTERPYSWHLPVNNKAMVVMFPRDQIPLTSFEISKVTATNFSSDTGIGRVINPFFMELSRNLEQLEGPDGSRLLSSALELLTTLLSSKIQHEMARHHDPNIDLVRRIQAYIRDNLGDPTLSPVSVADAHHISTRHLHDLFSRVGETVAAWIRQQRLTNIQNDLSDPFHAHRPVSAIAARWGLKEPAHFNRLFKARFGESPGAYRERVFLNVAPLAS